MPVDDVLQYARSQQQRYVDELKHFVALPSVSTQPEHAADVAACAHWLANHLQHVGLHDARVVATGGHPVVLASSLSGARRRVLVYGHYDVQPVEPLSAWHSPPFLPSVRGDEMFGRGVSDDKGQLFTFVKAIEAYLRQRKRLPVDLVCLFEGEEEIGSPNLLRVIDRHRRDLACDAAVMADAAMASATRPALVHAMRGALYLELTLKGSRHELHSGNFGGVVLNPLQALCEVVAGLHDDRGRIAVPGFYDRVRPATVKDRRILARTGPSNLSIARNAGITRPWGEAGYSLYERLALRPALTINGIQGGYNGAGSKGVIPNTASAKLSFRLVPDQDPREIDALLRRHLAARMPQAVRAVLRTLSAAKPALVDPRHPALRAAIRACTRAFGVTPALLRSGGTIPALHGFDSLLGVPTVMLGFAPVDANRHAADEKLHLPTFQMAIGAVIALFDELAAIPARRA
jgi:acetylornithine deacetylase/succinyl-diaminopimelate desuccinylase-like protein